MEKFKGTPGPWRNDYNLIRSKDGINISDVWDMGVNFPDATECEANANLIAAAPELLKLAFKFKSDLLNMLHKTPARDIRIAEIDLIISKALGKETINHEK